MIENDDQLHQVRRDLEYWRQSMTTGGSWLGNERHQAEIAALRREIVEYERRRAPPETAPEPTHPAEPDDPNAG